MRAALNAPCGPSGDRFSRATKAADEGTEDAAAFYRYCDHRGLDDRRLWRRLGDIERAPAP